MGPNIKYSYRHLTYFA